MDFTSKYLTPEIKLSCYEDKFFKSDMTFNEHLLIWFISGETKMIQTDITHVFQAGDIFLIPRNQLATVLNYPKDGKPHQTVVMHLSAGRLRDFYYGVKLKAMAPSEQRIRSYGKHPLLQSCMASLIPYFDLKTLPEDVATCKMTEAITILRTIDPEVDDVLACFEEPHRIDLVGFMEKNYMFNMPIEKFGYLTGRSLTTFKRDFARAFKTTPQKWLTQKRLQLAHFLLENEKKKPVDVCYEAGFENLSHFSFAFKKHFGYSPTKVLL